jgi:hypothetical protein
MVIVIDRASVASPHGQDASTATIAQRVAELETEGLDQKAALKKAAKEFGLSKSEAYRLLKVKK